MYCNLVLVAQRNFKNQLKMSLSISKKIRLGTCKLRFSYLSFYTYASYTSSNKSTVTFLTIDSSRKGLGEASTQDFIGDFATDFIKVLEQADNIEQERNGAKPLDARAMFVVQSSGTSKPCMLTEVSIYFS